MLRGRYKCLIILKVLMLSIMRSNEFRHLVLVIALPSIILAILMNTHHLINYEASTISTYAYIRDYVLIANERICGMCIKSQVILGKIITDKHVKDVIAYIIKPKDLNNIVKILDLKIIKKQRTIPKYGVVISKYLLHELKTNLGSRIGLSLNNKVINCYVYAIYTSRIIANRYVVVLLSSEVKEVKYLCLCKGIILNSVASRISKDLISIVNKISLLTLAPYLTLLFPLLRRITFSLQIEVSSLRSLGIPCHLLRVLYIFILTVLTLISAIYGFALGTLVTHIGIWILRFYNVYIPIRPSLSINELLSVLLIVIAMSSLASSIASKVIK